MATITNELVTQFSFSGSTAPLNEYNSKFSDAMSLVAKSAAIFGAVGLAVNNFIIPQLNAIDAMGDFAKTTSTNIEYMQEMGYVAEQNGGSMQSLQSTLQGLSTSIGEASMGVGRSGKIFEKLGISVKKSNGEVKTTDEILDELHGKFQSLSKVEQMAMASKLGIDKDMLQTLNLTNEEMGETRQKMRDMGIVSQAQADKVMELNDSIATAKTRFNAFGQQLLIKMLPAIEGVIGGIDAIIDVIVNVSGTIFKAIDYFIGFENAMMIAGAAVLYLNKALLMNPIAWVVAAIVGLILIVDDLVVAFEGGESVIADFFAGFDINIVNVLTTAIEGLKYSLNGLQLLLLTVAEGWLNLGLVAAEVGRIMGMDIDTSGMQNYLNMVEKTKNALIAENAQLERNMANRNYSMNQTVNVTQNIQGSDAKAVAGHANNGMGAAIKQANKQMPKGNR